MEEDFEILNVEYLSNHLLDYTQILNLSLDGHSQFLKMKTTSNGRQPQNVKSGRSQQPLTMDYTQILNLSLDDQPYFTNHWNKDDLKILKGECLSNHFLDHTQILKLSLQVQTACYKFWNEDDL